MQVIQSIALAAFPSNTAKAEEHLERLKEMRDNIIFKSLAALCQADISQEEASKLSKVDLPCHTKRVPVPVQPVVTIPFWRLKQAHSPLPSRRQLGRNQHALEGEILLLWGSGVIYYSAYAQHLTGIEVISEGVRLARTLCRKLAVLLVFAVLLVLLFLSDTALPVQEIVQRVGSKGPMGDFARALCAHLTPQLITVQHLAELLKLAQKEGGAQDEEYLDAVLCLLADSALAAPRMIASLEPQVPESCTYTRTDKACVY